MEFQTANSISCTDIQWPAFMEKRAIIQNNWLHYSNITKEMNGRGTQSTEKHDTVITRLQTEIR